MGNPGAGNRERLFFNPRSQTSSWLRVHEKCAHRSQNLVSSSPPVPFLFKSIFLPIRFLSGSTARTDKFLESQAHSHCSQLGPPSHLAPPLGRGVACCNGRCEGLVTKVPGEPQNVTACFGKEGTSPNRRDRYSIHLATSYESSSWSLSSVCELSSCIFRSASVMSSTSSQTSRLTQGNRRAWCGKAWAMFDFTRIKHDPCIKAINKRNYVK